jgi:ribosomal protein S18 acetylase RimI-like enzyme
MVETRTAIKDPVDDLFIREASIDDVGAAIRLDELNTGMAKPDYWRDMFERYGARENRIFLVSEIEETVRGFIIGEVRAWEFGSPPCGWIFALGVDPEFRLQGVGTNLFAAICQYFRDVGVDKVRTMSAVDDKLNLSFFRSQGLMGGPFIELEMPLD